MPELTDDEKKRLRDIRQILARPLVEVNGIVKDLTTHLQEYPSNRSFDKTVSRLTPTELYHLGRYLKLINGRASDQLKKVSYYESKSKPQTQNTCLSRTYSIISMKAITPTMGAAW